MRGGSTDTFGRKLAGRWFDGLPLPVFPDGRSATHRLFVLAVRGATHQSVLKHMDRVRQFVVIHSVPQLQQGLGRYFPYYNEARPHQSLGYQTPAAVYRQGRGGEKSSS
jgi:transposase InsO family protein